MIKRGYGLAHFLLVVIVVGLIAIALANRFQIMKSISRDTARVGAINELNTALSAHYFDYNKYPTSNASSITENFNLAPSYLALLPKEPLKTSYIPDFNSGSILSGYFAYMPGSGVHRGTMLLIAKMETDRFANFSMEGPLSGKFLDHSPIDWKLLESRVCTQGMVYTEVKEYDMNNPCEYTDLNLLRYVVIKHNS